MKVVCSIILVDLVCKMIQECKIFLDLIFELLANLSNNNIKSFLQFYLEVFKACSIITTYLFYHSTTVITIIALGEITFQSDSRMQNYPSNWCVRFFSFFLFLRGNCCHHLAKVCCFYDSQKRLTKQLILIQCEKSDLETRQWFSPFLIDLNSCTCTPSYVATNVTIANIESTAMCNRDHTLLKKNQ